MSWVGFGATLFAGATLGGIAMAFVAGASRGNDAPVCALCQDTGNHVHDELGQRIEHRWCICPLGRQYAERDFEAWMVATGRRLGRDR